MKTDDKSDYYKDKKKNLVDELERLAKLHSANHLNDEEFSKAKKRLLNLEL